MTMSRSKQALFRFPQRLSQALRIAVDEYDEVLSQEKKPYIPFSEEFHTPKGALCEICLVGGMIARRMQSPGEAFTPEDFPVEISRRLMAVENIRLGGVDKALRLWHTGDLRQDKIALLREAGVSDSIHWSNHGAWRLGRVSLLARAKIYSEMGY